MCGHAVLNYLSLLGRRCRGTASSTAPAGMTIGRGSARPSCSSRRGIRYEYSGSQRGSAASLPDAARTNSAIIAPVFAILYLLIIRCVDSALPLAACDELRCFHSQSFLPRIGLKPSLRAGEVRCSRKSPFSGATNPGDSIRELLSIPFACHCSQLKPRTFTLLLSSHQ